MKKVEEFLKYAKENPNVAAEVNAIGSKAKADNPNGIDEDTRNKVIEAEIIPLAKKYGFELTAEDFEENDEVSMEEADAVVAAGCTCYAAGGGGGTEDGRSPGNEGHKTYGCACAGYGQGGNGSGSDANCLCAFIGAGSDNTQCL